VDIGAGVDVGSGENLGVGKSKVGEIERDG